MHSNRTTLGPRLPFDTLVSILDQLGLDGDTKTLKACSFLRHDLLAHCRKHLFGTFDMRNSPSSEDSTFHKFFSFLSTSPHLAQYVRTVHVLDLRCLPSSFTRNPALLPQLLDLLTNVISFGLHLGKGLTWAELAPEICVAMTKLFSRSRCVKLFLTNIQDVPPTVLSHYRYLHSLTIHSCSFFPVSDALPPSKDQLVVDQPGQVLDKWPVRLKAVSLLNCETFISQFESHPKDSRLLFDSSDLRDLGLTFEYPTLQLTWNFIHGVCKSLQVLKIRQAYSNRIFGFTGHVSFLSSSELSAPQLLPYVTLAPMTQLSHFSFTVSLTDGSQDIDYSGGFLSQWCLLLRTAPPTTTTVSIVFDLFFSLAEAIEPLFVHSNFDLENSRIFLRELDDTLSDTQIFPSLTQVEIEILLPDDSNYTSDSEEYSGSEGPPEPMKLEEMESSIRRMMKLTRKRLGKKTKWRSDAFIVDARIGT